jgi:HPt (histidine-containing phosphotransfer) domain-containing protein
MCNEPLFDREAALESVDGHLDILVELAETFLAHCPAIVGPIGQAVRRRDAKAIEAAAHDLKGALGYLGANRIVDAASKLEQLARDGNLDSAERLHQSLSPQLDQLVRDLRQLVSDPRRMIE